MGKNKILLFVFVLNWIYISSELYYVIILTH